MNFKTEKRSSGRLRHQGAITFSIFNQQNCIDAQSLDYSTYGLKFKSLCALRPGTTICIRVKPGQRGSRPDCFGQSMRSLALAEVKWCREIEGSNACRYEVGVHYYPPDY
ncbi:MAG: hypothetical protein JSW26_12985 [Desulfobacterales bacterium]|nr:MAG: hypothetical protein JSW26_12985 [Desulfobacterales bacterium]